MLGHLADALAGGLPVDVQRLVAAAQLSEPQAVCISAGASLTLHTALECHASLGKGLTIPSRSSAAKPGSAGSDREHLLVVRLDLLKSSLLAVCSVTHQAFFE